MKHAITWLMLLTAALACCTSDPTSTSSLIDHVDGAQAGELIQKDGSIVVLDIRTPKEFAAGHVEGAVNIDFKSAVFEKEVAKLDREKKYLVHCRSGHRSTNSLPVFQKLGFKHVTHLDGGILDWEKAGLPTVK